MGPNCARAPHKRASGRAQLSSLTVVLLVLAFMAASVASAFAILLYTSWGRDRVCSILNRAVSKQIRGELVVERLEALSLDQVTARGIKIIAPDGVPAIEADRAVIDFSLRKLMAGEFGWSRADISHCQVRVTEDKQHQINMEETFKKRVSGPKEPEKKKDPEAEQKDQLDLQSMVTSDCKLTISGSGFPTLQMRELAGIMRVHVLGNGDTELRFDHYKGTFTDGLPTGVLAFREVSGEVMTASKRLLQFDGSGRTHGADVDFSLDIFTEPKKLVKIEATFPEKTAGSLSTLVASLWSKFSDSLDINVHYGRSHEKRADTTH
jgi:hypothetical protein